MDKQKDPGESKGIEKLTIALRSWDDEKYEKMNKGFDETTPYVFSLGFEQNMRKLLGIIRIQKPVYLKRLLK